MDMPDELLVLLEKVFKLEKDLGFDSAFLEFEKKRFSPLEFAVINGSTECFKALVSKRKVSIELMLESLSKKGISAIHLICESGNLELLKFLLPIYLNNQVEDNKKSDTKFLCSLLMTYSPIQIAVIKNQLPVIQYLLKSETTQKSPLFDLHSINPITGENCALLSLRSSNFPLVKTLYEKFDADFYVMDNSNRNAYDILAEESTKSFSYVHLEILMYLVQIIKVPLQYNSSRVVSLLEKIPNKSMLKYFLGTLDDRGIPKEMQYGKERSIHSAASEPSLIPQNSSLFSISSDFIDCFKVSNSVPI